MQPDTKIFWRNYGIAATIISFGDIIILAVNSNLSFESWLLTTIFGAAGALILAFFIAVITGERKPRNQ